jgi:hypothetical protein
MSAPDQKTLKNAAMADIRLVEAGLRRWDPIGVEPGSVAPADEYDSYAPRIVSMVKSGCTVDELAAHLEHLGSETMGLGPSNALSRAHSLKFAAEILGNVQPSNNSLKSDAAKPRTLG